MDITTPTVLTPDQYAKSEIAIDVDTGDHYLVFPDDMDKPPLWVGQSVESLEATRQEMAAGNEPLTRRDTLYVTDEWGAEVRISVLISPTGQGWNDLDLDELAQGRIDWR